MTPILFLLIALFIVIGAVILALYLIINVFRLEEDEPNDVLIGAIILLIIMGGTIFGIGCIDHSLGWVTDGEKLYSTSDHCVTVDVSMVHDDGTVSYKYRVYDNSQLSPIDDFTCFEKPTCEFAEKTILPYKARLDADREQEAKEEELRMKRYQAEDDLENLIDKINCK